MSAKNRNKAGTYSESKTPEEKISRLLALFLIKDLTDKVEKVGLLKTAGFLNLEIAQMLGMTSNHVNVAAHAARSKEGRKRKVKARK